MEKENKMGVMPMLPLILNISVPMMLSMLVQALYNIVDSVFVARLGENALTAVTLAFPVQSLMIAFAISSAVGVNALLSTRLGQGRHEEVGKAAMNGFFIAIVLTVLFIVLGILIIKPYFQGQTKDAEILKMGMDYLRVVVLGSFGTFGVVMSERVLQATGLSFYSMIAQMTGAVTNIILDPIMIFGLGPCPRMGTAGAALATVIGQMAGFSVSITLNLTRNKEVAFRLRDLKPVAAVIKQICKVGLPTLLLNAIMPLTVYTINYVLGSFTPTAVAVYGVYFRLNSFIMMPVFGLNGALIPIIAYNYGAKKKGRVLKALKIGTIISIIIMAIGTLIFELLPDKLLLIFNATPDMLTIGTHAMRVMASIFLLAAVGITFDGAFQALNAAMYAALHAIMRQLAVLIPVVFLLARLGDINLVWYAFPIAEVVSFAVAFILMGRVKRRRIDLIGKEGA